ncbi:MAG: pentapeptide repeat-containing protein [Pirellulales bacterium]
MAWRQSFYVAVLLGAFVSSAHAQIYRWDNGQVIPGTEGIKLGPALRFSFWESEPHNLRYADFSTNFNLSSGDFHYSWLDYARFQGDNLANVDFEDSVLNHANLKNANLTNARLYFAALDGANLTGAVITGANLGEVTLRGFTAAQLYSTKNYAVKDLHGIKLGENNLDGWDFHDQNLANADFGSSTLANANLAGANLTNAALSVRGLTNANLTGAVVTGASFDFATSVGFTAAQLYSTQSYAAKNLSGIRLGDNNLSGWDFHEQNLVNAYLVNTTLTNANLAGANLTNARMEMSTFTNANLTGANLTNSVLLSSHFTNANLTGADVRGAWVTDLAGAISKNTILPDSQLNGLNLASGEQLLVRNYHGNPDRGIKKIPVKINSSLTISTGGLLSLQLDGQPWDSIVRFQTGIPVQLGGKLELNFTDDTQLAAQPGRSIKVFDWTGVTPQGQFTVQGQSGTEWDTGNLYTTGEVTLLGISSDLDADRDVDSSDLTEFLKNWTGSAYATADKTWHDGDSDHDGDVDSADTLVFLSQWTGATAAEALPAISVPEPSGLAMLCLIAPALVRRSRNRSRR